jgi:hypothetical protein
MTVTLERLNTYLAGRYGIEREIGRGGMATVYLAHDMRHHRHVALKVLHPELAVAIGADRFLREIEIAAGLQHPHILPLYDSGDADGALYYVMPFVEGESLKEKLDREKQLAIGEAIEIARDVADALSYAHERGVVHRDIKPANILLASNRAVVSDFGVALVVRGSGSGRLTTSGLSLGTPAYMSPEQAAADRNIDGRSDIYSLGCVLYEMLTGDPPFTGKSAEAILAKKLLQPVASTRVVREKVPALLDDATLKALARTPADRFRTGAEFARALEMAAAPSGALVVQPQPPRRGEVTGAEGAATEDPTHLQTAPAAVSMSRFLGIAAVIVVLLSAIGFLTTAVYDVKMQVPSEYTPSRFDFPIVGVRALFPVLIFMFPVVIGFMIAKYALRMLLAGLRWMSPVRRAIDQVQTRLSTTGSRLSKSIEPDNIAELSFIGIVLVSVFILSRFAPLIVSVSTSTSDTSLLSESFRPLHRAYTIEMTVLIAILIVAWRRLSLYLRIRQATGVSVALARWGGLAWILALVMLTTMPWRLLWFNERPRALLNGERAYILFERDGNFVIYNAERRETLNYRADDIPAFQRLDTEGYVFESAADFTR